MSSLLILPLLMLLVSAQPTPEQQSTTKTGEMASAPSSSPTETRPEQQSNTKVEEKATAVVLSPTDVVTPNGIIRADLHMVVEEALDYAHSVGFIMRPQNNKRKSDIAVIAPFVLYPSPFPLKQFSQVAAIHEAMQLLYFRMSMDYEFLAKSHEDVRKSDKVVDMMLKIQESIVKEGIRQPLAILLGRADYMLDKIGDGPDYDIKQVEMNIGPVGSGGLTPRGTLVHRRIAAKAGMDPLKVPENHSDLTLARGHYEAWKLFGDENAMMITVCNFRSDVLKWDTRHVEYQIEKLSGGKLKSVMIPMRELSSKLTLAEDNSLRYQGRVVAVVNYQKAFNLGKNALDMAQWKSIHMIERSTAIKSPTIALALTATKKMQQVLAEPGTVERFFQPDAKDIPTVKAIRATFAGMWSLDKDNETIREAIKDAIAHPDRYVLKANRDGGGNNIWDQGVADALSKFTLAERAKFILMQRLRPLLVKNYMIRPNEQPRLGEMNSELSMYGSLVGDQLSGKIHHNMQGGYMVRTKWSKVNEGGIMAGTGAYDSPYLY